MTRSNALFLYTYNSARSEMAEGLLRNLAGDRYEVHSAGTEATYVRPPAVRVMAALDIGISRQESKTLDHYFGEFFEYVITVCDEANQRLHWSIEDPSRATGSEEERLEVFRTIRDRILERVKGELVAANC